MSAANFSIKLTGFFWLAASCMLLAKGFALISFPFYLIGCALGFFKGFFILQKTAGRITRHILSLSSVTIKNVYPLSYWITISGMMSLGFFFNFFAIPIFLRGFIDITIGTALATGSIFYFNPRNRKPSLPEKKNVL